MDQIKKTASNPRTGINRSTDIRNLKENDTTYVLNGNIESVEGDFIDYSYEKSNVLSTIFPVGFKVIGKVKRMSRNWTYYFLTNPDTKKSLFGYIDNNVHFSEEHLEDINGELPTPLEEQEQIPYNTFNILIDDTCSDNGFNFNINFPIHNPLIKEEKTGGEIYFTDFHNPSRFIKIDDIEYYFKQEVPCSEDIIVDCADFEKMRIHKQYDLPKISNVTVANGGVLAKGSYTFIVALSDAQGNEISEYSSITQPISIWSREENTGQAIKLTVTDLDPDYNHYKIVALTPVPVEVGVYSTSTSEITISDLSQNIRTSIEKVSFVNTRVNKVEGLTSIQNSLAEYGLVFEEEINLQPIVNLMGSFLQWQTHVGREDLYSYGDMRSKFLGFNRNEVVPYSIRFLLGGGTTTALFPLVAREATPYDREKIPESNLDRSSFLDPTLCDQGSRNQRWQYYNTATVTGSCESEVSEVETFENFEESCTNFNVGSIPGNEFEIPLDETYIDLMTYINDNLDNCSGSLQEIGVCQALQEEYPDAKCSVEFEANCGVPSKIDSIPFIAEVVNDRVIKEYDTDLANYPTPQNQPADYLYRPYRNNGNDVFNEPGYGLPIHGRYIQTFGRGPSTAINPGTPHTLVEDFILFDCINREELYTNPYISANNLSNGLFNNRLLDSARWVNLNVSTPKVIFIRDTWDVNQGDNNLVYDQFDNTRLRISFFRNNIPVAFHSFLTNYGSKFIAYLSDGNLVIKNSSSQVEFPDISNLDILYFTIENAVTPVGNSQTRCIKHGSKCYWVSGQELNINKRIVKFDSITIGAQIRYVSSCSFFEPVIKSCETSKYKRGDFAYWESERVYPDNSELYDSSKLIIDGTKVPQQYRNVFASKFSNRAISSSEYQVKSSFNLTCQPIRHFRFPDNKVSPFMTSSRVAGFGESYIYPLGVTIDENCINILLDIAVDNNLISREQRSAIYGYEIFRGNLAVDRTVMSSGLLYDMREYTEGVKTVKYSNYPYNSYSNDKLNLGASTPKGFGSRGSQFTYNSPETDYSGNVRGTEMNVQGYQFGMSKGWFDEVQDHPKMVILSNRAYNTAEDLATTEVIAESIIGGAQALASLTPAWLLGGTSSGGSVGYAWHAAAPILVTATILAEGYLHRYANYKYQWLEIFKNLGRQTNFANYYFSEGNYNYLLPLQSEGNQVRNLRINKKLKEGRYVVTDNIDKEKVEINNIDREQTTFLKVNDITYPSAYSNFDRTSLTYLSENGLSSTGRSSQIDKNIASPYVQIINRNPAVHGDIDSVQWVSTSYRGNLKYPQIGCLPIFGGDTFISRHTLKRKMPLFLSTLMGQANMTPFDYKMYSNIGTEPAFYINYDVNSDFSTKGKMFPEVRSEFRFDNETSKGFYYRNPSKFYLYYYGIPSFLTETRLNTNFREIGREPGDNFYPEVGDIGWWTQEKNVPLRTPNYFKYDQQFSNQTNSFNYRTLPSNFSRRNQDVVESATNGVILSLPDNDENGQLNPWLKFRPLDFHEFESKYGKLKELKGIENESVLARFADTSIIYNKVSSTVDDGSSVSTYLGGKSIFQRRTASFINSEIGYGGTQHRESLSCEFGHFYVDNKRGQIIQIPPGGGNMIEISNVNSFGKPTNMKDWFKRNLPMKITESNIPGIENFEPDNSYNLAGTTFGYDSLHKRILITKKDYVPVSDCIAYDRNVGFYDTCGEYEIITCPVGYEYNTESRKCEKTVTYEACVDGTFIPESNVCRKEVFTKTHMIYIMENKSDPDHPVNVGILNHFRALQEHENFEHVIVTVVKYTNDVTITLSMEPSENILTIENAILGSVPQTTSETDPLSYDIIKTTCYLQQLYEMQEDRLFSRVVYSAFVELLEGRDRPCFPTQPYHFMAQRIQSVNTFTGTLQEYTYIKAGGLADRSFGVPRAFNDFTSNSAFGAGGKAIYEYNNVGANDINFHSIIQDTVACQGCNVIEETCECTTQVNPTVEITSRIDMDDTRYFKEVSWTIAYNPQMGYFSSFMDYLPNFYVNHDRFFETGKGNLWAHNKTNKSYGVFYGDKYNFEIETIAKAGLTSYLGSIELLTEARRFHSNQDFYLNQNLTFNKSLIYNRRECSGEMTLDLVKGNVARYPITESEASQRVPITSKENTFVYNYFFDRVIKGNQKPFIKNDVNQIKIEADNISFKQKGQLARLNGDYFQNRLTYNTDSRFCLVLKLSINLTNLDNL